MWKCCLKCSTFPSSDYMFKVSKRNARTRSEICSKLIIKTVEHRSGVFKESTTQYIRTKGEGRGQTKCARLRTRGERGVSRLRTYAKKIVFEPQNLKIFLFLYKRSYYIAIYYCVQKSVNRSQDVNRNHRTLFDIGLVKFNLIDEQK